MAAAAIPYVIMGVSTAVSMYEQAQAQQARSQVAQAQAAQLEQQATEAVGIGQRNMLNERRQKELIASRAIALAAASGGSVNDPTVVKILSDISGEGAYRESVALYNGESRAAQLKQQADIVRMGGQLDQQATQTQMLGTALQGASSIYGQYQKMNPPTSNTSFSLSNSLESRPSASTIGFGYR